MRILFAAVRPGGWIALCEPDFNTIAVSPPSAAWVRTWTIFADAAVAGGWDPGYGTRMMSDLSTFDLEIFEGEASSRWVRGGSIGAPVRVPTRSIPGPDAVSGGARSRPRGDAAAATRADRDDPDADYCDGVGTPEVGTFLTKERGRGEGAGVTWSNRPTVS